MKLIPSEVVGLYLGGKNGIEAYFAASAAEADGSQSFFWIGWTLFCLLGLVLHRRWATSEPSAGIPPEWPAIGLAAVSFLVWVYSFGDVFKISFDVWHPLVATLLVLAWTFSSPIVYGRIVALQSAGR